MIFFNKKVKVAVHDGSFHADDVFSVAILSLYLKKPLKIFRTRDPKVLAKMDYVFDVGRIYSPKDNKFDHHQAGWNEKRENGIIYATAGLLWKEYGEKITGSKEVADKVDKKIIQVMDAEDNGMEIYKNLFEGVSPYCLYDCISIFNPTWTENDLNSLKTFEKLVVEVKNILQREIKKATDYFVGKNKIQEIYNNTEDKRILVLDNNYSWREIVESYPEPLYIVSKDKNWNVIAVGISGSKFKNRLDFPASWAGKENEELAKITGVRDAIFCHNGRFLCVAKSKEGAISLAKLAVSYKV